MRPKGHMLVDQLRFMAHVHRRRGGVPRPRRRRPRSRSASGTSSRTRLARWLIDHGVEKQDRVALVHGQRPLPALDHRVRGDPQGGRGDGAGEHAPVARRGAHDPDHAEPRSSSRTSACASDDAVESALDPDRGERSATTLVGRLDAYDARVTSRCRSTPTTWPTSCTPRARPACRRACSCGTATSR